MNQLQFKKMVIEKLFGITKLGIGIRSKVTVEGHEVMKNLSKPRDQILMSIDVYADYL